MKLWAALLGTVLVILACATVCPSNPAFDSATNEYNCAISWSSIFGPAINLFTTVIKVPPSVVQAINDFNAALPQFQATLKLALDDYESGNLTKDGWTAALVVFTQLAQNVDAIIVAWNNAPSTLKASQAKVAAVK